MVEAHSIKSDVHNQNRDRGFDSGPWCVEGREIVELRNIIDGDNGGADGDGVASLRN